MDPGRRQHHTDRRRDPRLRQGRTPAMPAALPTQSIPCFVYSPFDPAPMPPYRINFVEPFQHLLAIDIKSSHALEALDTMGVFKYPIEHLDEVSEESLFQLIQQQPSTQSLFVLIVFPFNGDQSTRDEGMAAVIGVAQRFPNVQFTCVAPVPVRAPSRNVLCIHCGADIHRTYTLKLLSHLSTLSKTGKLTALPQEKKEFAPVQFGPDVAAALGTPHSLNQFEVTEQGVKFEFLAHIVPNSRHFVVFGQSAITRNVVPLPYFFRWSWLEDFPFSTIVLNDPTLYLADHLNGGWFIGTKELDYVQLGARLIDNFASQLQIKRENIVFSGSSAGAFSSVGMACHLPGTHCFLEIPQFRLRPYYPQRESDAAIQAGLGIAPDEAIPPELLHRINLMARIQFANHCPNMYICPNAHDVTSGHITQQFGFFMNAYSQLMARNVHFRRAHLVVDMVTRYHALKGGHIAMTKDQFFDRMRKCMDTFVKDPVPWELSPMMAPQVPTEPAATDAVA